MFVLVVAAFTATRYQPSSSIILIISLLRISFAFADSTGCVLQAQKNDGNTHHTHPEK